MTTFRPFPRLPLELREQIWKDTVEPRTVDVRRFQAWPQHYGRLVSSTPIPAILQSCREARNLGLYKKVFFEVAAVTRPNNNIPPEIGIERFFTPDEQGEEAESSKTEQRYVWMDLDIDIMDIGTSKFDHYKHIAPAVKRLKFERENTDEYFYFHEVLEMMQFINVEEIHIVCADGFWNWGGALHEHNFPCADEKLLFIDALDGRVARGMEMEKIYREMLMAVRIANTGEAYNTDDEFSS